MAVAKIAARQHGVVSTRQLLAVGRYRQAVRQAAVLGLALGPEIGVDRTRSELEFHFLELCRRFGLPLPEVNVRVGAAVVDFLWRNAG
jgi:hypothetical protein